MDFTLMIFKLIVSMIVIFALMIILFKYANKGINGNLNKKVRKGNRESTNFQGWLHISG